ncbi:MAG: hypothetical protein WAQ27_02635 [Candidatus Microsaccharimonas sp.]
MITNKYSPGSAHVIIITILTVAILAVLGFVFWQNFANSKSPADSSTSVTTPADVDTPADQIKDTENGSIAGNVRYPIEWISAADRNKGKEFPDDLKVCAVDPTTKAEIVCDQGFSSEKTAYKLEIATGSYLVRATTGTTNAYYDLYVSENPAEFDPCAASTSEPIIVTVTTAMPVTNIHAGDFWVGHLGC